MTLSSEMLHVAHPYACNMQQMAPLAATPRATPARRESLKALARKALACNTACNTPATPTPESVQQTCDKKAVKCCTSTAADPRQPGEFGDWRDGLTSAELQRIRGASP